MDVSVIIPTYNRAAVLSETLQALSLQAPGRVTFEVIVVDDGSTDETASVAMTVAGEYPVPFKYFFQKNQKQGAARNLGARNARGRLLLFLGDDTIPEDGFVEHHHASHFPFPEAGLAKKVVIGYTTWPSDYQVSRFLHYIGEQGWQFGFSLIEDRDDVPFNFFYTSNLSLERRFFLEAGGFDTAFNEYGWEDIELSLRLKHLGMRMVYNPRAVAYHDHPTDFSSFRLRQLKVGYSAWSFYKLHPEMEQFLGINKVFDSSWLRRAKMGLLGWLCSRTEHSDRLDFSRFYPDLMSYYYGQGLAEARRSERAPAPRGTSREEHESA